MCPRESWLNATACTQPLLARRAGADLTDEQVLERLLGLNLERAAEEAKAQESPKQESAQRNKAEHDLI
ncbi:MAG: hypothetical protein WCT12_30625 [Verrucomicrobiota bacterium]